MGVKKIGLIGFGAIGKYLFNKIQKEPDLEVAFVNDPNIEKTEIPENKNVEFFESQLPHVDLVIEAANTFVVKRYAEKILKVTNFMPFSIAAFSDQNFYRATVETANNHKTNLFIPHGAIIGLDGLIDGKELIDTVEITTIKKPKGFGRNDQERTTIYQGNVYGACEAYPKNVNVHGLLALAGIGFEKTSSKIIADPDIKGNTHNIIIKGNGFKFEIMIESIPKGLVSGAYTPESAFGSVKRALSNSFGVHFV